MDCDNIDPELRRAEMPQMIRDFVAQGYSKVRIEVSATSALRIANDIEFAVRHGTTQDVEQWLNEKDPARSL